MRSSDRWGVSQNETKPNQTKPNKKLLTRRSDFKFPYFNPFQHPSLSLPAPAGQFATIHQGCVMRSRTPRADSSSTHRCSSATGCQGLTLGSSRIHKIVQETSRPIGSERRHSVVILDCHEINKNKRADREKSSRTTWPWHFMGQNTILFYITRCL